MDKPSLRFRSLDIRQMPGFPRGLFNYTDFHDSINIIAGPNASGKSSTAYALQQVIWPSLGNDLQAVARILIDGEEWRIEKKLSRTTIQREGQKAELPSRPSQNERRRYVLSLHDLVQVEDKELAQLIVKESVGGYDLEQARGELEYDDQISTRSSKAFKLYEEAADRYEDTRRKQSALKERFRRIEDLREQKEEAEKAEKAAELFTLYREYKEAGQQREQARQKLDNFPGGLDRASGDEAERLDQIKQSIRDKKNENVSLEQKIEEARNQLESIDLPEEGLSNQKHDLLDKFANRLQSLQNSLDETERRINGEREKAREALRSLEAEVEEGSWEGISSTELSDLEEWVQNAFQVTGERQLKKRELKQLREESSSERRDRLRVKEGIALLAEWLERKSSESAADFPAWSIGLLIGLGAATGIATHLVGVHGLWGIAGMIALGGYLWLRRSGTSQGREATQVITKYENTQLPAPQQWSVEQVVETIDHLTGELEKSRREEHRQMRMEQLKADIDRIEQDKLQEVKSQRDQWLKQLGTVPEVLERGEDGFARFYWFVNRLNRWQNAREEIKGGEQTIADLRKQKNEVLEKIDQELSFLDEEIPGKPEEVGVLVREVERREQRRQEAARSIETNRRQLQNNQREIEQLQAQAQKIADRFDLEQPELEEVRRRVKLLDDYKDSKKEYEHAEFKLSQRRQALETHPLYEQYAEKLEKLGPDQLKREQEELKTKAREREKKQKEIQEIQTLVDQARNEHDLEEALQDKEEAVESLEELYNENISAITGNILVGKIKRITRNQNRPAVFTRASQLFNRITGGRYDVQIEEENRRFNAYDNIRDHGLTLDQLSTGTRIQLLLSVRLAFIETQEQAMQLPLIADELLANSDEQRARAIIRALVEMSREGRQIFYFTAQADEVYKWKTYLDEHNREFQLFEIGQETGGSFAFYETYRPPADSMKMLSNVPEPDDKDHQRYGEQLNVPSFDLVLHKPGQLHLWYLIEDVNLLYECLRRDIRFWGGLRSYLEHGGRIPGLEEDHWERVSDRVKWLDRFQNLYCQGRPVPIDRSVLEETDAVTETFLEAVDQKLQEVKGDPRRLLDALRDGEVSRFQKAKMEELKEYLLRHDYIDEQESLPLGEIQSRLQAYVDQLSISREETQRLVDRILDE